MTSPFSPSELAAHFKERARGLGFDLVGIAPAARPDTLPQLQQWLQAGFHGEMQYLPRRSEAYAHPSSLQMGVRSVILAALNYGPPVEALGKIGRMAAYAQGSADYHDVLRGKLSQLADVLHELQPGCRTRCAVDTAPLLERDFARRAGLGWFGKNTMLINKHRGSYFFLGAVLTDCELPPDEPHSASHCGTCTRCLDACPTQAFPEPHVLDATKCISYLTIELRNAVVPRELRTGMENWLFGCDVCQEVCPWNRHAEPSSVPEFSIDPLDLLDAGELVQMTEAEFSQRYGHTPLARPGWGGMTRNAAIVLGNSGDLNAVKLLIPLLTRESAVVRETAVWALGQLGGAVAVAALEGHAKVETSFAVLEEIRRSLRREFQSLERPNSLAHGTLLPMELPDSEKR